MKIIYAIGFLYLLSACWPSSVSFTDKGSMPEEWKTFSMKTIENNAPNCPLSYPVNITEAIKNGIQNNTKLLLNTNEEAAELLIDGVVNNYTVAPVAVQNDEVASLNRLTVSINFNIFVTKPKEEVMKMTSSRFLDYDSNIDFSTIESTKLDELNKQIVQDVINKLYSNW